MTSMTTRIAFAAAWAAAVCLSSPASAGEDAFHAGPVFSEFGKVATVEGREPIPPGAEFKVSFDVVKQADAGELNRSLVSAARFINMHVENGVPVENIQLALVVHGSAVRDVTGQAFYGDAVGGENANVALIEALTARGVSIEVCGQSAAYYDVATADLAPGVKMSLSAMTAHALLQQDGYTVNPF